jgi:transcriptional regulator
MHPNPIYKQEPKEQNIEFARERSFGILSLNAATGPLISHVPFLLSEDGTYLEAHLQRNNPILSLLDEERDAVIAVSGGDCYISPDWYGVENQVPTWNYVAVHLRGKLKKLPTGELRGVLERLSASMEERLRPKKPWTIDKMDQRAFDRMAIQIVPIAMKVEDIQGTWKLSQNKTPAARAGAVTGANQAQLGSEISSLTKLMASQLD